MYYYLLRIISNLTNLKKHERILMSKHHTRLKENFIQKILPYLSNKKGLLTEVITWEGGIEQRFGKGIGRKELEDLEEWGVAVLRELQILEDFKSSELQKWIPGKRLSFNSIEESDEANDKTIENIDFNEILNGIEQVWERGCRRWKGKRLINEIIYLESVNVTY
jgi:hypothetical protein